MMYIYAQMFPQRASKWTRLSSLSSFSDFDSLNEEDVARNNQLAFDVAERVFGIQPVIRGHEMAVEAEPDKLLMVLYLSKFYEAFRNSPGNDKGQAPSRLGHSSDCDCKRP